MKWPGRGADVDEVDRKGANASVGRRVLMLVWAGGC